MTTWLEDVLGRNVRLTTERIEHITCHPEMEGIEPALKNILARPDRIIRSNWDNSVELFYQFLGETKVGPKWCCVVVKYLSDDAFVITAYLTDKLKQGKVLWPST